MRSIRKGDRPIPKTLLQVKWNRESCTSSGYMDWGASCKIEIPKLWAPTVRVPRPVSNRIINEGRPNENKNDEGTEMGTFCKCAESQHGPRIDTVENLELHRGGNTYVIAANISWYTQNTIEGIRCDSMEGPSRTPCSAKYPGLWNYNHLNGERHRLRTYANHRWRVNPFHWKWGKNPRKTTSAGSRHAAAFEHKKHQFTWKETTAIVIILMKFIERAFFRLISFFFWIPRTDGTQVTHLSNPE